VVIPDSVTEIGANAFYNCSYYANTGSADRSIGRIITGDLSRRDFLTSVTLPKGLTSVGRSAFSSNSVLETVIIPEGMLRAR